ncbi:MAG: transcription antitermination factor NusB [Anaerolineales bacterium]|nr:transcription antitermination factor NusB [Anaerolineales bacterium]
MKRERRRARSLVLQTLYEVDTVKHQPQEVIARHIEQNESLSEEGAAFLKGMVEGVWASTDYLDHLIASCAPDWPVDQLAVMDRNILRMALWELATSNETPLKVAINEAVELAKRFGSDSSARFINGVLGTLAQRENEIRSQFPTLDS